MPETPAGRMQWSAGCRSRTLIVPHCDPVVNEYNQIYAIRNGTVETVWDVTARGCSQ